MFSNGCKKIAYTKCREGEWGRRLEHRNVSQLQSERFQLQTH